MKRRAGLAAVFLLLLAMSLSVPLMIEAIFPGGRGVSARALPPEESLPSAAADSDAVERARLQDNLAWLAGDSGSALDAGNGAEAADAAGAAVTEENAAAEAGAQETPLDLRPGAFAGYTRSWDSLDIRREMFTAGAFVFFSSHTRLQASGSRLRFRDDTDRISGDAWRLDGAHRLPAGWLLEEGLERDEYDGLHGDWNGDARLSGAVGPVGVTLEGGHRDMWERLANIRDRLSLWEAGLGLFYQLLPRLWIESFAGGGWLSDHNRRANFGAEAGYMIAQAIGLSVSAGLETTAFADQRPTYWSPSYYHLLFGRLRLTRNFERAPFEALPGRPMTAAERWGYLAELTAGVNDDGRYEQSLRGGLGWRATRNVRLRTEFYHLDSKGRFDDEYSENRVDAGVDVRFGR